MMKRRWLLAACLALPACSVVPRQPYVARRDWPLVIPPPAQHPARADAPDLLVRSVRAGPGLDQRGLQVLAADGSLNIGYYDQWAVLPAEAVEQALRQSLAASGLFGAVVGPGSQLTPKLVLETELTTLLADPAHGEARASLSLVLLERSGGLGVNDRVLVQTTIHASAPLAAAKTLDEVAAMRAAIATLMGETQAVLAAHLPAGRRG